MSHAPTWSDTLQIVFNVMMIAWAIWAFVAQRRAARKDHVDMAITLLRDRMMEVEQTAKHAPNHGDLTSIYGRIDTMAQGLATMQGQFAQMNNILGLIHQSLLQGGGKSE